MTEYKKTFEDEVDWKIIEQLHNATNNFSSSSLEFKKLYFVIIGISTPIIFKVGGEIFDISLLLSPLFISFFFWFLDCFTYYYQEKLREKMDKHFDNLKLRNTATNVGNDNNQIKATYEDFTLENKRTAKTRLKRSIINPSSIYYPLLIFLNIILIICHYAGCF